MEITDIKQEASRIRNNINKVIIGKEHTIDLILTALISGGHILLEDTPGTGKTMLAKSIAKSIDAAFSRIQFTPDLLPSDITGINVFNPKTTEFDFIPGPAFTNILLADEINRATPRTQSSLLECMEEKQITTDGVTRDLQSPFFIIATENPIETTGTYPLPEAQLDRFMMKLSMGLPSASEELDIINRYIYNNPIDEISSVCSLDTLLDMQKTYQQVYVADCIRQYIVDIVIATRNSEQIVYGINSRGTLAILKAAKAYAAISGRDYVIPDDIKTLAPYIFSHRIITYKKFTLIENQSIINEIIDGITVPTEDWEK